jgi:hypothetical protein
VISSSQGDERIKERKMEILTEVLMKIESSGKSWRNTPEDLNISESKKVKVG